MLNWVGLILGLAGGFAMGLIALGYITRGLHKKDILQDQDKRLWLGLLGWGFAAVGAALGWWLGGAVGSSLD